MTVRQAWFRLYACIVAKNEEEFIRAYYPAGSTIRKSCLWKWVSGQTYIGKNIKPKKEFKDD